MYRFYYASNMETMEKGTYDIFKKEFDTLEEGVKLYAEIFFLTRNVILEEIVGFKNNQDTPEGKEEFNKIIDVVMELDPENYVKLHANNKQFLIVEPFHLNYCLYHTIELYLEEIK